jgi:hypothetical protein
MGNYIRQIQSRYRQQEHVRFHVQFDSFVGQKPIVLALTFNPQSMQNSIEQQEITIQLKQRTFEEYDYAYDDEPINGISSWNATYVCLTSFASFFYL